MTKNVQVGTVWKTAHTLQKYTYYVVVRKVQEGFIYIVFPGKTRPNKRYSECCFLDKFVQVQTHK